MSATGSLDPQHSEYLAAHAVDVEMALELGVRSITSVDDLPEDFRSRGEDVVPAIYFPWTNPDGNDEPQLKAMNGTKGYFFRSRDQGYAAPVWAVRQVKGTGPVLITEGSKQTLVAARYAPPEWSVYGISGCWGWMFDGRPSPSLELVEDRDVVVIFDSDRLDNPKVWDASEALEKALIAEGAASVKFADPPGQGTTGLDDLLAAKKEDRRHGYLSRLLGRAEKRRKTGRPKDKAEPKVRPTADRPVIDVMIDKYELINALVDVIRNRWDGSRVFDHGGVLTQIRGDQTDPLTRGTFADLLAESASTVAITDKGIDYAWPDATSMAAMMSRTDRFTKLERLTKSPFIRPDGSICQTPGYDADTGTYLILGPDLEAVDVPTTPTKEQVASSVALLRDEWLADMPFPDDASRANALALVLTPLIRGLVALVPLAVVDGLQMGVGKNLLADCISILTLGHVIDPLPYAGDSEETRKVITSALREGSSFLVFDEAHVIEGVQLARAVTAIVYSDRILGVSNMAKFPNRTTWMSLGNGVQVNGDMARRVYRIALRPTEANPQDRLSSTFKHPHLREWTAVNRAELLTAALTLARAWFAAGKPKHRRDSSLGSFEAWEETIGGILGHAGVTGFLENLAAWRSESDFEGGYWAAHLEWLRSTFGTAEFTTAEVTTKLKIDQNAETPPGMDDTSITGYSRKLGQAYAKRLGRSFGGLRLGKASATAHRKVGKWTVAAATDSAATATDSDGDGGTEGTEETLKATRIREKHVSTRADAHTRVSHGETGAECLLRSLRSPGPVANGSPIELLLAETGYAGPPDPTCEWCGITQDLVPPALFWFACRACHPSTFVRTEAA